jgi:hypothetical protein
MAKRKSTPLNAGLLVRKGEATPATDSQPLVTNDAMPPPARRMKGAVALTVKLDPKRYHRLLEYGARFTPRRTNQEIIVAALDAYLDTQE